MKIATETVKKILIILSVLGGIFIVRYVLKEYEMQNSRKFKEYKYLKDELKDIKSAIKNVANKQQLSPEYNMDSLPNSYSNTGEEMEEVLHELEEIIDLSNTASDRTPSDSPRDVKKGIFDTEDGSTPPFKKYTSYRLIWFTTVRSNYINASPPNDMSGAGFAAEALDFIIPLCKKHPLFGWIEAEASTEEWKRSFLVEQLSMYEKNLLEKCNERGKELMDMDDIPGIGVITYMPYNFGGIKNTFRDHTSRMRKIIGRCMFETDNVPPRWADLINDNVDELWVPTKFHVDVFRKHGVKVPVYDIGEGYDPIRFDRDNTESKRSQLFPNCNEDDFIFIGASQYIDRKGFDHVFEAYATAFSHDDKVCIAVRAGGLNSMDFDNPNELRRQVVEKLDGNDYVAFFRSGDIFVSGSHGEGWGRTSQTAMAMGLPVIIPIWGGATGYAREDVVIPVTVDGLEQAFPDMGENGMLGRDIYNHKWAEVQVPRLRKAMRWAYDNQEEARAIGLKAEHYQKQYFTRAVIADNVLKRTDAIIAEMDDD